MTKVDDSSNRPPGGEAAESSSSRRRRKLSAIMMVDVSGFSRMMGSHEDETVDLIQEFHKRVQAAVERFEGRVVDTAGDSVFGEFDSLVNAVSCAREIQQDQAQRNQGKPAAERLDTRIGVHLGDVIVEDYHVYGDGVNIAARLEPIADPGGICISEAVYQQVRNKLDLPVRDMGLRELKNIQYPVRVFKIALSSSAEDDSDATSPAAAAESGDEDHGRRRGRRERYHEGRVHAASTSASPPVPEPLAADQQELAPAASWTAELMRSDSLILLIVGGFLLLSPILLFPTGGVFPTGGAILISIVFGRIWARRSRKRGRYLVCLGIGIATGAIWTGWSAVTNSLFVLAGVIVAASGFGRRRHRRTNQGEPPPSP
jgi:class 3 adenylate cyclase